MTDTKLTDQSPLDPQDVADQLALELELPAVKAFRLAAGIPLAEAAIHGRNARRARNARR